MEFVGRKEELSELESLYRKGGCAVAVYGRRRIGKTALLEHFCESKNSLFLRCLKGGGSASLDYFSETVSAFLGNKVSIDSFMGLTSVLETVVSKKTVIVIDEYPYISTPMVSSLLQHFIDGPLSRSGSMLILCGSSISSMKREAEDSGEPLFGRFRRILEVPPLSFQETKRCHPGMDDLDALKLFLTVGGIPRYHQDMDYRTFRECIVEGYFRRHNLTEEAELLIDSEFPNPRRAMAVLSAIGRGSTSLKEIAEKVGIDKTLCSKCIALLEDARMVAKVSPMLDAPKRPVYYIRDSFLAFHYAVVKGRGEYFNPSHADKAYSLIENDISTFLGKRFETYCADLIRKRYLTLEMGTWWMDKDDEHSEIDVVAVVDSKDTEYSIFAECKFRRSPMGNADLELLKERSSRFDKSLHRRYFLFSLSGFDRDLADGIDPKRVILVGPETILSGEPLPSLR